MAQPDALVPAPPGDLFDLTGRTALVTGASSGLGARRACLGRRGGRGDRLRPTGGSAARGGHATRPN